MDLQKNEKKGGAISQTWIRELRESKSVGEKNQENTTHREAQLSEVRGGVGNAEGKEKSLDSSRPRSWGRKRN